MAGNSLAVGELLLEAGADIHAKDEVGFIEVPRTLN